jgi:DNA-binding transcriptional ArsR family regulator
MPAEIDAQTAHRLRVLKALAHPTRLWITQALVGGERCVCELHEQVGDDLSTISKHLALLKKAGVLESEKRGLNVYYRLRCDCFPEFLNCTDEVCGPRVRAGKRAKGSVARVGRGGRETGTCC